MTEEKEGYPEFDDGCISRQRTSEAIPLAQRCDATSDAVVRPAVPCPSARSQLAALGVHRGHPRLSSVLALPAAGGFVGQSAEPGAKECGHWAPCPSLTPGQGAGQREDMQTGPGLQPHFVVIAMYTTNLPRVTQRSDTKTAANAIDCYKMR